VGRAPWCAAASRISGNDRCCHAGIGVDCGIRGAGTAGSRAAPLALSCSALTSAAPVVLAIGWHTHGGARLRPPAGAMAARPPRCGPGRSPGGAGTGGRAGHRGVRRHGGWDGRGERRACGRVAYHVRAGTGAGPRRSAGGCRRCARAVGGGASGLSGGGVPALGAAPRTDVPRPAAAGPTAKGTAQAAGCPFAWRASAYLVVWSGVASRRASPSASRSYSAGWL
jgi:hypothetical protein